MTEMPLSPVVQKLVLHWGEMGARWGINRTVAQIHALLYFCPQPLCAEDIVSALEVARSHVSNSLKALRDWGVVRVVHRLGDRRDHFESLKDVWQLFEILLDERKRREVDPTVTVLRETAAQLELEPAEAEAYTRERLADLLGFFETVDAWYHEVRRLPRDSRKRLMKLGPRLAEWLR